MSQFTRAEFKKVPQGLNGDWNHPYEGQDFNQIDSSTGQDGIGGAHLQPLKRQMKALRGVYITDDDGKEVIRIPTNRSG